MFKVGFKADIPLFFCFFASDVSFFFCVFPIAIPPVISFFALLPGVSLATLLYPFPPFPLLLYLCPPPRHPPCTPSPQPTESPYLSAVCLTYLSLLWNIKESASSSLEESPPYLQHVHAHTHTHNVNYSVSKDSTTLRILSFQSLLLAFRDWQTAHGMLTNSAPLRPLRYMYAVRKTFGIWAWVTASQWYICLFLNTN